MLIKFTADAKYIQDTKELSREYKKGETYEVTEDHGRRWIRRQVAEEVKPEPKPEPQADPEVPPQPKKKAKGE